MKRISLLTSAAALLLSACGGGSGSTPAVSPPVTGNTGDLVVTSSNAKPAARVAYDASSESRDSGGRVSDAGLASSPGGFQKPGAPAGLAGAVTSVLQKVPVSQTVDCGIDPTFGTQTLTYDFAAPGTLSANDTIVVEFTDCDQGLGEVLNGRMEMTVRIFSGDLLVSGLYLLEMDVMLIDFRVTTATDEILSNGDSTVSVDTTGNPLILMSISGNSLATVTNTTTQIVTNFDNSQSVDTTAPPEPYTLDTSGTVDSTELDGIIAFTTPVTFQGAGDGYPFAGELLITGANGATIRLVALSDVNVRIDTDSDGDGMVDDSETTTWDDIAL